MSTQVRNIVETKYTLSKETRELVKRLGVEKYLPPEIPKGVSFELHGTTTELANALKVCMNGELEVLCMEFDENSTDGLTTDDRFIKKHELAKRIKLIPIRQISDMRFTVNVKNRSDEILPVYAKSIREKGYDYSSARTKAIAEKKK